MYFADSFLHVAKRLANIKTTFELDTSEIEWLEANKDIEFKANKKYSEKQIKAVKKRRKENFLENQDQFLFLVTQLPQVVIYAIDQCSDKPCLNELYSSSINYVGFGRALNEKTNTPLPHDELLVSALEIAWKTLKDEKHDEKKYPNKQVIFDALEMFLRMHKGEISAAQIIDELIGNDEFLNANDLKRRKHSSVSSKSDEFWLRRIKEKKLRILSTHASRATVIATSRPAFANTYHIKCDDVVMIGRFVRGGAGPDMDPGNPFDAINCFGVEDQRPYRVRVDGFEVGFYNMGPEFLHIKISSSKKIAIEGTWRGMKATAGLVIEGGGGVFLGKGGSVATLGFIAGSLIPVPGGGLSPYSFIEITPVRKPFEKANGVLWRTKLR